MHGMTVFRVLRVQTGIARVLLQCSVAAKSVLSEQWLQHTDCSRKLNRHRGHMANRSAAGFLPGTQQQKTTHGATMRGTKTKRRRKKKKKKRKRKKK